MEDKNSVLEVRGTLVCSISSKGQRNYAVNLTSDSSTFWDWYTKEKIVTQMRTNADKTKVGFDLSKTLQRKYVPSGECTDVNMILKRKEVNTKKGVVNWINIVQITPLSLTSY